MPKTVLASSPSSEEVTDPDASIPSENLGRTLRWWNPHEFPRPRRKIRWQGLLVTQPMPLVIQYDLDSGAAVPGSRSKRGSVVGLRADTALHTASFRPGDPATG